jgi:hypothetical protein
MDRFIVMARVHGQHSAVARDELEKQRCAREVIEEILSKIKAAGGNAKAIRETICEERHPPDLNEMISRCRATIAA